MPTTIALLGLNRFSGSLGLALTARNDLSVIAYAGDPDLARIAQSRRMAHRSEWNLLNAVENADVIILSLPLGPEGMRETLKLIAPQLRSGAVVIGLTPLLGLPLTWAADLLPEERHFVAVHPILNPAHLYDDASGLDSAQANLFEKGLWALASTPTCAPEAVKLASDLGLLVQATPYFIDPAEHDGLMGGVEALPALLAWALMRVAVSSSGWTEMRKVADRAFATATVALGEADAAALHANRESVLRYLDAALAELQSLRTELATGNGLALADTLAEAETRRATWRSERQRGEWEAVSAKPEMPTLGDSLQRIFTGGLFGRKNEKKS
jgi:prephenate dehydrogenase